MPARTNNTPPPNAFTANTHIPFSLMVAAVMTVLTAYVWFSTQFARMSTESRDELRRVSHQLMLLDARLDKLDERLADTLRRQEFEIWRLEFQAANPSLLVPPLRP